MDFMEFREEGDKLQEKSERQEFKKCLFDMKRHLYDQMSLSDFYSVKKYEDGNHYIDKLIAIFSS